MKLARHPKSQELAAELLSRPSPTVDTPAQIMQLALMPMRKEKRAPRPIKDAIAVVCEQAGVPGPGSENHHHINLDGIELRWEQHTEFSSIVLIRNMGTDAKPFPTDWLSDLDAHLLTGTLITIESSQFDQSRSNEWLNEWINEWPNAVGGSVLSGLAEIATTLQANEQGLVEYKIINHGLDEARMGRLTQRLYEIETYRMMALLGLPLAKQTGGELNHLEQRLVDLVERLGHTEDLSEDQALLDELFALAQSSEQLMADTDYRFSATQAYGRIVHDRLEEIGEVALDARQRLSEFLDRRFEPALRTTANITRRQDHLSARIARVVSLARTRVEVSLQTQHRTQLEAMARRAQLQLRLQRTVEGLSVMAISYYAIGILGYLLGGWLPTGSLKLLISITSPVLLLGIWYVLRRWRRKLMTDADSED
ncbi:MAG TPA: DUF3422 domain-containing protein [Wenzhouxiangella sp.]